MGQKGNIVAMDISQMPSFPNQKWFLHHDVVETKIWHKAQVTRIVDLLEKGKILEKQKLEKKLGQKLMWFRYTQIQHLLSLVPIINSINGLLTDYEQLLKL